MQPSGRDRKQKKQRKVVVAARSLWLPCVPASYTAVLCSCSPGGQEQNPQLVGKPEALSASVEVEQPRGRCSHSPKIPSMLWLCQPGQGVAGLLQPLFRAGAGSSLLLQ